MKNNYLARMGVTEGDPYTYPGIPGSHHTYTTGEVWECRYAKEQTCFRLLSPGAEKVKVKLYRSGRQGNLYKEVMLYPAGGGFREGVVKEDLNGCFYTFQVYIRGEWLAETPGLFALAVGVNGKRAAIIDWSATHPEGWQQEERSAPLHPADAVIYELHLRDFSTGPASGIRYRGKYLAFTQEGTYNREGRSTGIDHLKELGITHLHLLPVFDFSSVDETDSRYRYNWGYDPQNYNVPEGSYATDAYDPVRRIREFKEMVMALHRAGIRVVMDVVYNHTWQAAKSAFE